MLSIISDTAALFNIKSLKTILKLYVTPISYIETEIFDSLWI